MGKQGFDPGKRGSRKKLQTKERSLWGLSGRWAGKPCEKKGKRGSFALKRGRGGKLNLERER